MDDDGGSLLLLAGFVIGLSLIVTGLTLSQVAELEKEAAREQDASFLTEYRAVRGKLGTALEDSVTPTTDRTTFKTTFESVVQNFDQLENTRSYAFIAILARADDCSTAEAIHGKYSECLSLTCEENITPGCPNLGCGTGRVYNATGPNPTTPDAVLEDVCYDGLNDGILEVAGVIKGAYVYLHLDNPGAQIQEARVYPLNR